MLRSNSISFIFSVCISFFCLCGDVASVPVMLEEVLASIDGEPVTETELRASLSRYSEDASKPKSNKNMTKEAVRMGLIGLLLDKEGSRLGVDVSDADVNQYIDQVRGSNDMSMSQFERGLAQAGYTLDEYKKQVRSRLLKNRILGVALRSKVQVSDAEVKNYLDQSAREDDTTFSLLKFMGPEEELEKFATSQDLESLLKSSVLCPQLSSYNIACKHLGVFESGDLKEEIQQSIEEKAQYEMSDLLEGDGMNLIGYVKVPSVEEGSLSTYTEVRERLFQERFMKAAEDYLDKELFKKYSVEIF